MWTKIPASTNNLLWDFTHLFEKETIFNRSLIFIIGASCMSLLFFPPKKTNSHLGWILFQKSAEFRRAYI